MIEVMKCEIEKIIKTKNFLALIIIALIVLVGIFQVGFNYSQLSLSEISNQKRTGYTELYRGIANEHAGEFNDKKVKEILSDFIELYQSEIDGEKRPFDLFSWDIAEVFFPKGEDIYLKMNDAMERGEKITIDEINLLSVKDAGFSNFSNPLKIGSYTQWNDLYKVLGGLFILISLLVIVICSTVFSGEVSSNINQLLLSTKYGRSKMILSKIIAATGISIILFIAIHAITFIRFYFHYYALDGWNASVQTNFSLKLFNFPVEVNHLQVYFLILIFQLFGLLATVGVTLFISSITKSTFSSLLVATSAFFLPLGLSSVFRTGIIYKLLCLFPINIYNPEKMLTVMAEKGFIFNTFAQNFIFVIFLLLVVKILGDLVAYFKTRYLYN